MAAVILVMSLLKSGSSAISCPCLLIVKNFVIPACAVVLAIAVAKKTVINFLYFKFITNLPLSLLYFALLASWLKSHRLRLSF